MKKVETVEKKESGLKKVVSAIGGDKLVLMAAIIVVFVLFTSLNSNFLSCNGCEITSCCEVLRYLGFDADKCQLADRYLPRSQRWYGDVYKRQVHPRGDPHPSPGQLLSGNRLRHPRQQGDL